MGTLSIHWAGDTHTDSDDRFACRLHKFFDNVGDQGQHGI